MQNVTVGLTITNTRTGATGKVIGFVQRWNGRHDVKKVKVESDGDEKIWAFSSCKVVEEAAPRILVTLKELLAATRPHCSTIVNHAKRDYDNIQLSGSLQYILEDNCLDACLTNTAHFQDMGRSMYCRLIMLVMFEFENNRVGEHFGGGLDQMLSDMFRLYTGKKPQ